MSLAFNPRGNAQQVLRIEVHMQVRVWGMTATGAPFIQNAEAVDAGPYRALLVGLDYEVPVGEIIGVAYEGRKGRFSVVRAGEAGTAEAGKIEIRPLDMVEDFWGIDFKQVDGYQSVERRAAPRYQCRGSISMRPTDGGGRTSAAVTDVSLSGCYVEMMQTFPVGTKLSALLNVESISISFNAEIRTAHPGVGMGMKFEEMSTSDQAALERLIAKLAAL